MILANQMKKSKQGQWNLPAMREQGRYWGLKVSVQMGDREVGERK